MSFNANSNNGTAEVLPVTDFLQFLPSFGAGIVLGVVDLFPIIFKNALKTDAQLLAERATSKGSIGFIKNKPLANKNIFDSLKSGIGKVTDVTKKATIPTKSFSKLGSGLNVATTGIFATTALLSLTPGGQNLVTTSGQGIQGITNLGSSFNNLLKSNPLIPIGLLILAGLVVVSVIKK